jgi:hypothetical protein
LAGEAIFALGAAATVYVIEALPVSPSLEAAITV